MSQPSTATRKSVSARTPDSDRAQVGVVGLGVMGAALARNLARRGHTVAGFDVDIERAQTLSAAHPEAALHVARSLTELVGALSRPRRLILLAPAGSAVDDLIAELRPLLQDGDALVDGGNSRPEDTERRCAAHAETPHRFIGMGVSGGEDGALYGPALMPGGDERAYPLLQPLLESIAAVGDDGPCVGWCGRGAAGHFVKLVHNGIEYGVMQALAEVVALLRPQLPSAAAVSELLERWNEGPLGSYLLELTVDILRTPDPQAPARLLLDMVVDQAAQKGTGRWTVESAAALGVPIPTLSAAVDARLTSHSAARREFAAYSARSALVPTLSLDDLRAALTLTQLACHAQGFELLATASLRRAYGIDLREVARIWTGGCILRARLLPELRAALSEGAPNLLLAPPFVRELGRQLASLRRVVLAAVAAGAPVPALAATLSWLDMLATERGTGALIQALRDSFGAHGYERTDGFGEIHHSKWRAPGLG